MSSEWIDQLRSIEQQFDRDRESLAGPGSPSGVDDLRNRYLSRKSGLVTVQLQNVRNIPAADRAEFGRIANELKTKIETALDALKQKLAESETSAALERERLDITLPGNRRRIGLG